MGKMFVSMSLMWFAVFRYRSFENCTWHKRPPNLLWENLPPRVLCSLSHPLPKAFHKSHWPCALRRRRRRFGRLGVGVPHPLEADTQRAEPGAERNFAYVAAVPYAPHNG